MPQLNLSPKMALLHSLVILTLTLLGVVAQSPTMPDMIDMQLEDIQLGLEEGCFSSEVLVETYLRRIEEVNEKIRAVTEVNPDAIDIAKDLDRESPLHGIPILLKNNIATADRLNNTAGSFALLGATTSRDAKIVSKLREAGAIILGKTNLSQWAFFRSFNMPNGWSSHGGQGLGVYHENQDPQGSSSGSAVAADLGLAIATIGTETIGSLLAPAGRNNVVGIKPTVGLVSRDLVIPVSEHMDTVGPMARTVRDAAQLLQVIVGEDTNDNYTSLIPYKPNDASKPDGAFAPDYASACDNKDALDGARIGVPWNILGDRLNTSGAKPELDAFRAAVREMQDAGAIVLGANFTAPTNLWDVFNVLAADFKSNLPTYLKALKTNPNEIYDLEKLREWTKTTPIEEFPRFDVAVWNSALDDLGYDNTDPYFWDLYQSLLKNEHDNMERVLTEQNLSALILPTSISPETIAVSGAPAVSVPMSYFPSDAQVVVGPGGLIDSGPGVPMGLTFMGRDWSEQRLIELACSFEQRTQTRKRAKRMISPRAEVPLSSGCKSRDQGRRGKDD